MNDHTRDLPARVEAVQSQYASVFVFRFVNLPGSPHREILKWDRFGPESEDTDLAFTPAPTAEVFFKGSYSCLSEDVVSRLCQLRVSEVHLCGMDTNACVLKTAVDLFEQGFQPIVLSAACASHSGKEYHEAGLKLLAKFIGPDQVV